MDVGYGICLCRLGKLELRPVSCTVSCFGLSVTYMRNSGIHSISRSHRSSEDLSNYITLAVFACTCTCRQFLKLHLSIHVPHAPGRSLFRCISNIIERDSRSMSTGNETGKDPGSGSNDIERDDWLNISDPTDRRKAQNRIAQRRYSESYCTAMTESLSLPKCTAGNGYES